MKARDLRAGYTPLHVAVDAGQCEVIIKLMELGANLEARSAKDYTPLALATLKVGHVETWQQAGLISLRTGLSSWILVLVE